MYKQSSVVVVSLIALLAVATLAAQSKPTSTKTKSSTGKELLDKNGCLHCHYVKGEGGLLGPVLDGIKGHRSEAYIVETLTNGTARQFPDRYYPKGVLDPREYMSHVRVNAPEARKIARYLLSLPESDEDLDVKGHGESTDSQSPPGFHFVPQKPSTSSQAGLALYKDSGCAACHSVAGIGGKIGPALDGVGARRTRPFIEMRISEGAIVFFGAQQYKPSQYKMPPADLSREEIEQITDFLLTLPVRTKSR